VLNESDFEMGSTSVQSELPGLVVCAPVFNDWDSALTLLGGLDAAAAGLSMPVRVVFVDDGSTDAVPVKLERWFAHIAAVEVVHLRRNLGHQRAIALGLAFIYRERPARAVVVMDCDGEDRPEDIAKLLARCEEDSFRKVVFAKRARRSEGLLFRSGYLAFKLIHRVLVGTRVEVGNFSVIPGAMLDRIVGIGELWNHYAAALVHARIAIDSVPLARGKRYAGKSKMNLVSLVTHGMSAISVYGDRVGVRLLCFTGLLIFLTLAVLGGVVGVKFFSTLAIPGWATTAAGLLMVLTVNLLMIALVFVLFVLQARNASSFILLRDWEHYVVSFRTLES
jgi:glycosyltransferase involved in cell wall biosynthesis